MAFLDFFKRKKLQHALPTRGGWFPLVKEPWAGAWQQNRELTRDELLTQHAVYSCISLVANDISKLEIDLKRRDENGIYVRVDDHPVFGPVLKRQNRFQNRIQFIQNWVHSLLSSGACYVLKARDKRGVVSAMYVLDPARVEPLVHEQTGEVFYRLQTDSLAGIAADDGQTVTVPASELLHDRINAFYHPLIGISPLAAASLPILLGREAQTAATNFNRNSGRPSGILTAPGAISDETVEQIRQHWSDNYGGNNAGRVAVMADGLTYQPFQSVPASDAQLLQQLNWTAETVASVFHVPGHMIGVGETPSYDNINALNEQYYSQTLQTLIEQIELLLTEGLKLPTGLVVSFNLDGLLRMDELSLVESEKVAVGAGIKSINESRARLGLPPKPGGDDLYLQQQYFSLEALQRRNGLADPFNTGNGTKTQLNLWQLEAEIAELKKENRNAA